MTKYFEDQKSVDFSEEQPKTNSFFETSSSIRDCIGFSSKNFVLKRSFLSRSSEDEKSFLFAPKKSYESSFLSYYGLQSTDSSSSCSLQNQDDFSDESDYNYIRQDNITYKKKKNAQNYCATPSPEKPSLNLQKYKENIISTPDFFSTILEIKSQKGCRYYQNKVATNPDYANNILFPLLKPVMHTLINDQFGNYLYQQFFTILNHSNMEYLIRFISGNSQTIFFSEFGSRIVQRLLEIVEVRPEFEELIYTSISSKILGKVRDMSIDEFANHILQKYITVFDSERNNFIFEEICYSFLTIAQTKYGCCIVQKCITNGNSEQKAKMFRLILKNTFCLISDQFGNYIYQTFILLDEDWIITSVYQLISKELFALCKKKYSSNVIEKFFEIKNKNIVNFIAKTIISTELRILELASNQFGNYILQKMLKTVTDKDLFNLIIMTINKNSKRLKKISFGKKFLANLSQYHTI